MCCLFLFLPQKVAKAIPENTSQIPQKAANKAMPPKPSKKPKINKSPKPPF